MACLPLKDLLGNLAGLIASQLGAIQALVISKVNNKINEIYEELKQTCPPPEVLESLAKTVNTLETLIAQTDGRVNTFRQVPKKLDKPIKAGKIVVQILSCMPIPSSVPPGIGVPLGVIQSQARTLVWAERTIQSLENDKKSIEELLSSTDGVFNPIKARLAQIQSLIARCTENPNLTDEERANIINSAQTGTGNENDGFEEDYLAANGRVYKISIRTDKDSPAIAPKRQAIAKDFRGIIVFTGQSSFASSTDVLKKELKFRIDNELL